MTRRSTRGPAVKPSAAERAYGYVKERILDGEFEGGALISEGEIGEALQISRTPVREAFLRLQTEGWMRLYPKRGAAITPIMPDEIEQVIEARALIESHAVHRLSGLDDAREQIAAALHEVVEQQLRCIATGDVAGFARADADFHQQIVAAGGNELLGDFYGSLRDRQRRMTVSSLARDSGSATMNRIVDQHQSLADLIASGNADEFEQAIIDHLSDVHRRSR